MILAFFLLSNAADCGFLRPCWIGLSTNLATIAREHVNRLTRPISSFSLTWWLFHYSFGKIWKVMLVSDFEQYVTMSLIFNIWFSNGCRKLSIAVDIFIVPPMPSHGDFPWLVARKDHNAFMPKSSWPILKKMVYLESGKEVLQAYQISWKSERVDCMAWISWHEMTLLLVLRFINEMCPNLVWKNSS